VILALGEVSSQIERLKVPRWSKQPKELFQYI